MQHCLALSRFLHGAYQRKSLSQLPSQDVGLALGCNSSASKFDITQLPHHP
jgi:hypothetical protein